MNHKLLGKDFALVVAGQIVSLFGNAILRFSLPLFLLRETGSSALFGAVTACSLLPMIVLSLLGGVLADRVNKRNIMVILDFSTAGIIAGFSILMGTAPAIPLFIVTLMLLYGISGTYQPAVQASIPALVAKDYILTASAIVNQIGSMANFIGPVIGGWIYGLWGLEPILEISVGCFALSAVMEIFIKIPFVKRPREKPALQIARQDLLEGCRFLRVDQPVFLKVSLIIAGLNLIHCGSESDSLGYDHRRHSGADCGAFRVLRSTAWSRPGAAGGRRCAWRPIDCAPWQAASARASLCISDPLRHAHAADGSGDALEQYSLFEVSDSVGHWYRNYNFFYYVQHPNACCRTEGNAGTSDWESHRLHYDADHVCSTHWATDLRDFS